MQARSAPRRVGPHGRRRAAAPGRPRRAVCRPRPPRSACKLGRMAAQTSRTVLLWQAPTCVADDVDIVLLDRLLGVLDNGDTTEAALRGLTDDAAGLVRALR